MKNVLINLKQIDQSKVNHTDKGNDFVALKMVKLKEPRGTVTHLLFHAPGKAEAGQPRVFDKQYVGTVCSHDLPIEKIEGDSFHMLFVEGGSAPTAKHGSRQSAKKQAEQLALGTKKRVYILAAIEVVEYEEPPIEEMIAASEMLEPEKIPDSEMLFSSGKPKRKRIPKKA